jgi:hypothetical protein
MGALQRLLPVEHRRRGEKQYFPRAVRCRRLVARRQYLDEPRHLAAQQRMDD